MIILADNIYSTMLSEHIWNIPEVNTVIRKLHFLKILGRRKILFVLIDCLIFSAVIIMNYNVILKI